MDLLGSRHSHSMELDTRSQLAGMFQAIQSRGLGRTSVPEAPT